MAREQIDRFMNAIAGIESGGSSDPVNVTNSRTGAHGIWQVMPSNWSPWAREAGLGGNAPKTAENQRKVAKHKMRQYYDQFGSWEAVAVAWFAGPGRAQRYLQGDQSVLQLSDGNTKVGQYVDKVRSGMGGSAGASGGGGSTGGGSAGSAVSGPDDDFTPPPEEFTHDAGALLAEVFGTLSDTMAGRDPSQRVSFGGQDDDPDVMGMVTLPGATGRGLMEAGRAIAGQSQRSQGVAEAADPLDEGVPITDEDDMVIPGGGGGGGEAPPIEGAEGLDGSFSSALARMVADAPGNVSITSGYRSNERQERLWQEALRKYGSASAARKWVAPPGKSKHNHGLAADLNYSDNSVKQWVHQNAANYGLHFPLGNEDWHVEPAGSRG